jgi:alkylation response protein AidB-like acyl-CoA dehydrogenase
VRFAFTDDQLLFRDTVRDLLQKECSPEAVRYAWVDEDGHEPDRWRALADMGVIGLTAPEASGGLGLGDLDLVLLLQETGRAALPEPIVETTAVVVPLLAERGDDPAVAPWLARLVAGDTVATADFGGAPFFPGADYADLYVAERDGRVVAVPGDAVDVTPQPSVDGARRLGAASWAAADEIVLATGAEADAAVVRALDRGALGTAAQLLGVAEHLLDVTVDYVKQREQFGVPVGSFQAVKHHLADAALQVAFAAPVVHHAAYALAHRAPTASRDVSMAKCFADEAAELAARTALQCHGAIGYTVEYDLHLWLKRVWALSPAWGDTAHHRARVAAAVLGPDPSSDPVPAPPPDPRGGPHG